jgi:two-component system sensor histidine kinase YesM
MEKKVKHLRDELMKTFLLYALIPIAVIMAVGGGLAALYWDNIVVERNHLCLAEASQSVENLLTESLQKASAMAEACQMERLKEDGDYKVELYGKLYEIKKLFSDECDFYVFDEAKDVVMGSRKFNSNHFFAVQNVSWGLIKRLAEEPDRAAYEFISPIENFSQTMDIVVGKAIVENEKVRGYIIYIISGNKLLGEIANPYADIIIKDSFDYAPICTNGAFVDDMHKLKAEYRDISGYASMARTKYYAAQQTIMEGNLTVYSFTSLDSMVSQLIYTGAALFFALVFLSLLILFSVKREAFDKTKMMDRLVEGFTAVRRGDLTHKVDITSDNEFKLIGDSYNMMLDSLHGLMKENEEKARETVILELKQLESQFNPHFIFNALENARYMIKIRPDAAERMIVALSNLLRYSIDNTTGNVNLKDDMMYLQRYLDIQKLRYGMKLNYDISIEPELYSSIVPKLFLQPIVENAIKYGFKGVESLFIDIQIKKNDGNIIIRVCDNGTGLTAEETARLNALLESRQNETNHSGLYNVNRRIKLLYGNSYGIMITKNEKSGIAVYLVLPILSGGVS